MFYSDSDAFLLRRSDVRPRALPAVAQVHDIAERTARRIEAVLHKSGRFMDPEQAGAEALQTLFAEQPVLGSCYQAVVAGHQQAMKFCLVI